MTIGYVDLSSHPRYLGALGYLTRKGVYVSYKDLAQGSAAGNAQGHWGYRDRLPKAWT